METLPLNGPQPFRAKENTSLLPTVGGGKYRLFARWTRTLGNDISQKTSEGLHADII